MSSLVHGRYFVALGSAFVLAACGGIAQSDLSAASSQPSGLDGGQLSSAGDAGALPDSGVACATWTTESDCQNNCCLPIISVGDGTTFIDCKPPSYAPSVISCCASPPGLPNSPVTQPNGCVLFAAVGAPSIPAGWTKVPCTSDCIYDPSLSSNNPDAGS